MTQGTENEVLDAILEGATCVLSRDELQTLATLLVKGALHSAAHYETQNNAHCRELARELRYAVDSIADEFM